MKKTVAGVLIAGLIFSAGTTVWAGTQDGTFQEMLPFMQQMHPDLSDNDLQAMYESCHGSQ